MKIGIDLGTTNTSVQLYIGKNLLADLDGYELGIPTLFMHNGETGKDHFGHECVGQSYVFSHPEDVVRNIKTKARTEPAKINTPGTIISGGKPYSYREVIKLYLEYILNLVKTKSYALYGDNTIQGVCITVPASSGSAMMLSSEYREMLSDILVELTGLPRSKIYVISEPVAAAVHYLSGFDGDPVGSGNQTILVFDLGGGTLDVTVMTCDNTDGQPSYAEKKIDGDPDLGGNHWDKMLATYILEQLGLNSRNPGFIDSTEEFGFLEAVVAAKHNLTTRPKTVCSFYLNNEPYSVSITRETFDSVTSSLFEKAVALARKVADTYDGNIDKIVLVGGSSNMPQIRQAIEEAFSEFKPEDIVIHDPSKAIAKGAATYLGMMSNGVEPRPPVDPIAESTYGWSSLNSFKNPPKEMLYNILMKETPFNKQTSITVDVDSAFHAVHNEQKEVTFTVYESNVTADECEEGHWIDFGIGQKECGIEVTVPVAPEYLGRAREYNLYPRMRLDMNGVLSMEIYDSDNNLVGSQQNYIHKKSR